QKRSKAVAMTSGSAVAKMATSTGGCDQLASTSLTTFRSGATREVLGSDMADMARAKHGAPLQATASRDIDQLARTNPLVVAKERSVERARSRVRVVS